MTDCVYKRNPEHSLIPRKEIEAHPWAFKCNAPSCFWVTCHNDQADAERTRDRHKKESCPHNSGVKKGTDRMTIQHKIWDRLDEATAAVMTGKPSTSLEEFPGNLTAEEYKALVAEWTAFNEKRGNARGLAAAIFELNVPSFETVTDVAKLAVQRYKAKNSNGEIEMPLTPGYDYSPQVAENRNRQETARAKAAPAKKAAPKKATAAPAAKGADRELNDGELGALKNGINAKLPFSSLASVYKISEARVQQIADELAATPS